MSHTTPTQGNINHSMRTNYNEFGVDEYYRKVNASYRNPFFPGIRKVIFALLDRWWKEERQAKAVRETSRVDDRADEDEDEDEVELRILDMAAGSGEASLVVEEWFNSRFPPSSGSSSGSSSTTTTPNNPILKPINPSTSSPTPTLPPSHPVPSSSGPPHPLASLRTGPSKFPVVSRPAFIPPGRKGKSVDNGTSDEGVSGRPAVASREAGGQRVERTDGGMGKGKRGRRPRLVLMATDPYTVPAYETRTGKKCLPLSFTDIAQGKLGDILPPTHGANSTLTSTSTAATRPPNEYDLVICSFALHLVGDASEMFSLLYDLSRRSRWLAVIAPHKKPEIKEGWGYTRWNFGSWKSALDVGISDGMEEDEEEGEATGQTRSTASMVAARDGGLVNHGQEIVLDRVRCRLYRSVEV